MQIPTFDLKKLPPQSRQLTALFYQMNYHFQNIHLAILALTHRSFNAQHNYERLEFLGDALLGVIVAEALYQRYPQHNEGQLSRMRASLVKEKTLVGIAKNLQLFNYLILGVGERKGGGRHRASILADSVEALIGAIYLDSGSFETVKQCVLTWYQPLWSSVEQPVLKDAKSRLQELLQAHQLALPNYQLLEIKGNAPNQIFIVRCEVVLPNGVQTAIEQGESRRVAEQKTAELLLTDALDKLPKLK